MHDTDAGHFRLLSLKGDPRIFSRESFDHGWDQPGNHWIGASNPQFSRLGIGKELDLLHALTELLKDSGTSLEQSLAIYRRLDASRCSIEQSNAERMLQRSDSLRYRGLGDVEARRRLGHATPLHDGVEETEVAQLEPDAVCGQSKSMTLSYENSYI